LIDKEFDALTSRLVHPTSPVLLTRNGPLRNHLNYSAEIH